MTFLKLPRHLIFCGLTLSLFAGCVENAQPGLTKVEQDQLQEKATQSDAHGQELQKQLEGTKKQLDETKALLTKAQADADESAKKSMTAEAQMTEAKTSAQKSMAEAKSSKSSAEQSAAELNRTQASLKNAADKTKAAQDEAAVSKAKVMALQEKVDTMVRVKEEQDRTLDEVQKRLDAMGKKATTLPVIPKQ